MLLCRFAVSLNLTSCLWSFPRSVHRHFYELTSALLAPFTQYWDPQPIPLDEEGQEHGLMSMGSGATMMVPGWASEEFLQVGPTS
jgi:hypothetical protein